MTLLLFVLGYSCGITVLLIFLSLKLRKYQKWYQILLINPDSQLRVHRFFIEMEPIFKRFYPRLEKLVNKKGAPLTDINFQFRWLIWWKFFGQKKLQTALRLFNESQFLREVLRAPGKKYTRYKFKTFREKLGGEQLKLMQEEMVLTFHARGLLKWVTIIIDSFPLGQSYVKRTDIPIFVLEMRPFHALTT